MVVCDREEEEGFWGQNKARCRENKGHNSPSAQPHALRPAQLSAYKLRQEINWSYKTLAKTIRMINSKRGSKEQRVFGVTYRNPPDQLIKF